MDPNPPTTADFAYADADRAKLTAQDCLVIIGWLAERVQRLEIAPGLSHEPLPELPSSMRGFACTPRREEAVKTALAKLR